MDPLAPAFLLDDRMPLPERAALDGFAFDGADLIVGTAGLAAREAARGPLPLLSDGCHILTRPAGDGVEIGTDAAGYRHLFHWQGPEGWAVGESFLGLVAHLRARGIRLEEDKAQSGAWLSRRQIYQQLATRRTAVQGIMLLGRDEVLRAGPEGLGVTRHPRPRAATYEAALREFLETWLSRCLTLHRTGHRPDGLRMVYHLSGGLDSRAVAAFGVHLARRFGPLPGSGFRSLDDAGHAEDLPVARRVAERAGLPLNAVETRPGVPFSPERVLARWERDAVGVYAPVRLIAAPSDPRDIGLSGHGGGGYKQAMAAGEVAAIRRAMHWVYGFYGHGDRRRFRAHLEAELAHLAVGEADPGQVWNRFARASRSRFHGGLAASYKTQVSPFDSRLAEIAADSRPPDSRLPRQFHHDILASLAPDLLDLPYDDPRKAPDAANRRALTAIADLRVTEGRVWGAFVVPEADAAPGSPLCLLVERIAERRALLPRRRVNWLFLRDLDRVTATVRAGGKPHPTRLRCLHNAWLLIRLAELGVTMQD